jgi:peptidoglycan hydrolase-like protein with peptidoglycan-binding domain
MTNEFLPTAPQQARTHVLRLPVAVLAALSAAAAPVALPAPAAQAAVKALSVATATTSGHVLTLAVPVSVSHPTLRYGSTGAAVVTLQTSLKALHYDVGSVDGVFGYSTLHGLYAFQKVQRIGVDGVVGPITWAKLASPYRPKPRHTLTAAAVEVNLSLRVVYVTKGGQVTRILDASPGKPSTPTVTGSFRIYRRINAWHRSPLGLLYRPNFFYGGYALHGSSSVPTYAASHGCVRVTVPAMDRLWSQLSIGERFYVYR